MPPRRNKEGAAPGKAELLDRTHPKNGTSDKRLEELKEELVAGLDGPSEPDADHVAPDWLEELRTQLSELAKPDAAETAPARPAARKRKTGSRRRGKAKPKTPARGSKRTNRRNGRLDLNAATFEQLRVLGLSVTQCSRLIACRDARGGYGSLDELDEVPGLPKATRAELRSRLTLRSHG